MSLFYITHIIYITHMIKLFLKHIKKLIEIFFNCFSIHVKMTKKLISKKQRKASKRST